MPEPRAVTFRDQTTGTINDLLGDEGKVCAQTQNLLGYLAGMLLSYKDEGVEFAPSIVVCDDLSLFLRALPGAVSHTIGSAPLDPASGSRILKDCAPLTSRNWFIFIERSEEKIAKYGVFTYFKLPTTISLHESISINPNQFCVLVQKISVNSIQLRGAKGSDLTLIFSTVRETANFDVPTERFSFACCSNLGTDGTAPDFRIFFKRLIETSLASCHGTILVCGPDLGPGAVQALQDAVPVDPALDFYGAFTEFQTANSAGSILNLQRCEELLHGFLRCDGMVLFDTQGRVTAYRVFFRTSSSDGATNTVVGGARRRAYEGVKALVGKELSSVLFRSQDGLTLQHGAQQ